MKTEFVRKSSMYFSYPKTIIILDQPIIIETIVYSAVDNEGTYYTLRELKDIEKNPNAVIYNETEYYADSFNNYYGLNEPYTDHLSYYYEV